jgi:hypothetical protein
LPNIFTVSGSPITNAGTLSAALNSQTLNTFFAAPDGANGTPSFRALVPADIPSLDTSKLSTGTLSATRGGTGQTTPFAPYDLLYGQATSWGRLAANSSSTRQFLQSTGNTINPTSLSWTVLQSADIPPIDLTTTLPGGAINTLPTGKGGTGLSSIGTSNQLLGVNNAGLGLEYKSLVAGSNLTITNSGNTITIDASGTIGVRWDNITSPVASLALAMGNNSSTFTYGTATGAGVNSHTITDTASNTGTGYLLSVNTATGSAEKPLRVTALGTANGVEMSTSGTLQAIGAGNINATQYKSNSSPTATEFSYLSGATSTLQTQLASKQGLDATLTALAAYNTNGFVVQTAADTFTGRTITGTTNQIVVTNGNGVSGNPVLSLPQNINSGATPNFAGANLTDLLTITGNTGFPGATSSSAFIYRSAADGLTFYGAGNITDVLIANKSGATVFDVPTGTNTARFSGNINLTSGVLQVGGTTTIDSSRNATLATVTASTNYNTSGSAGYQVLGTTVIDSARNAIVNNLTVGASGGTITKTLAGAATYDYPSVPVNGTAYFQFTVAGAAPGDVCTLGIPAGFSIAGIRCNVSGVNTVSVTVFNTSASAIDPASDTFKVILFQQ